MPFVEVEVSSTAIEAHEIVEWDKGKVKKLGLPVTVTQEIITMPFPGGKKHTLFVEDLVPEESGKYKFVSGKIRNLLYSSHTVDAEAARFFLEDSYSSVHKSSSTDKPKINEGSFPILTPMLEILRTDKAYSPPDPVIDGFYVDNEIWYFLLWSYKEKNQVLLKGNSGTGKTSIGFFIMDKINRVNEKYGFEKEEYSIYDMQMSNPESELKGSPAVLDGKTYFKYSRFSQNIQKPGLSLLNEINRGGKMVQNILLSVLDDQKVLLIERAEEIQKIPVHPEHTFWATANIGVDFTGTTQIDKAFMRRFDVVELVTPPESKRVSVLSKRFGVDNFNAKRIVAFSEKVASANLSKTISIAEEIKIAQKFAAGFTLIKSIEHTVLHSFSGGLNGEQAQILALIQSC